MHKKVWVGFIAAFLVFAILDTIVNVVLLKGSYESTAQLWRPEAEMKIWLFYVVYAFQAFFLSLIFSKGYEGKGVSEGARYGLYVGLMVAIPMAYGTYGAMPIPYHLALQWFIYGTIEFIVAGCVLAMVFGKQAMVQKVSAS
jgi:hypothetical protein